MKYYWKVWLWENGSKSTEFTDYLVNPIFTEPHLDETIGSGEIILDSMPSTIHAYPPKTKFRIEKYLTSDFSDSPEIFDYLVESDQVEYYTGCPELCCHRIQLIDPSVVGQGMHVDNIALTRELNDNDLNYKTATISTDYISVEPLGVVGSGYERPSLPFGDTPRNGTGWHKTYSSGSYKFTNSFRYVWSNTQSLKALIDRLNGLTEHTITFTVPTITCQFHSGTVPETLFECPVRTKVIRTTLLNNKPVPGSEIEVVNHFYNPTNIQNRNDYVMYNSGGKAGLRYIKSEEYKGETGMADSQALAVFFDERRLSTFPAMINTNDTTHTSKNITFNTTVLSQTEIDAKKSYLYTISCVIEPYESGAIVQSFTKTCTLDYDSGSWIQWIPIIGWIINTTSANYSVTENALSKPSPSQISITTTFYAKDMLSDAQPNPFLVKPKKYSCFDLIRKAMLTVDTQIIDNSQFGLDPLYDENYNDIGIQYPIVIDPIWMTRLKETQLFETTFEVKNLWEVFLQVGYYLHAIPYLKFAKNEADKFELGFRQLGDNKVKNNNSTKITIFNSQNLSEYFTQLDSYVTNIFSPQNEVEEWLTCKTSDESYLISNNTAELQTKYNITEIVEFDIQYNGTTLSALNYIFEKTVYQTLSAKTGIIPAKWAAIYYEMGNNKILGLNYVPPTVNNDGIMALKKICGDLFGVPREGLLAKNFRFNELKFHIKYKTQDTLRISQFKPNLYNFLKNSSFEKYPHHEQYYGQEDKIVDSERFSANLWGRLVRTANGIYQCQEYAEIGEEKEVGDLVEINHDLYYVMSIENEYYNDIILQKVTYSKNYNQISQIVTIPSEPRFYEISERSQIRREVRLMDFLLLTTKQNTEVHVPNFINTTNWKSFIKKLLFTDGGQPTLPNFAFTRFKADRFRQHLKENNEFISINTLYPNAETEIMDGVVQPKASGDHRDVIVPLLHFPLRNAIVFEWDMDDNFKAGDAIDTSTSGKNDTDDEAYYSMQPVRYCDVMGKADLFSFRLFNKTDWTMAQSQRLPFAEPDDFIPTEQESIFLLPDTLSIGLDKDNREAFSGNYQINLINSDDDERDNFVIFSNIFGQKNGRLKMLFLNHAVSMFDETVELSESSIVADNVQYNVIETENEALKVEITEPTGINMEDVKAIILYDSDGDINYAYMAKNVGNLDDEDKLQDWWIYPVFTEN